jgi:hypothetical protein
MAVENTNCVSAGDYEEPNFTAETIATVAAVIAAFFTGGAALLALGPVAFSTLRKVLEYMLNGKLVCLGGDRCAIGHIAELEPVGYQKPFPDNIDDDYSINIVLAESSLHGFVRDASGDANEQAAKQANLANAQQDPVQGALVREQPTGSPAMPEPREPKDGFGNYHGYFTWFEGPDFGERVIMDDTQVHIPFQKSPTGPFPVPVFHAECEGNRISNLLDVLNNIPPGLGAVCKAPIFGPIFCAIVSAIFAPIVAAALAIAWATSEGGDPADAGAGTLEVGELVVLNGRWTYDAGHSGWNELHALKTIQKIPDPMVPSSGFEDFHERWCSRTNEAPPAPDPPGTKPAGMTPQQEQIWEEQQHLENDWELHPEVDGCAPTEPQPEPEPPH